MCFFKILFYRLNATLLTLFYRLNATLLPIKRYFINNFSKVIHMIKKSVISCKSLICSVL